MTLQEMAQGSDQTANEAGPATSQPQLLDVSWVGGRPAPKPPIPHAGQVIENLTAPPPNIELAPTVTGSAQQAWRHAPVSQIRVIESTTAKEERFHALQQWEGVVDAVSDGTFLARLVDRTADGPDEEAEFDFAEIPSGDRELVSPGAVFYWSVGYGTSASGTRSRASIISFRRLPAWTEVEKRQAKERAQLIAKELGWGVQK
jgi:hypothetical protein